MKDYGRFQGRLGESAATLLEAFTVKDAIWQKLERVYVYARMRRDEDNRVSLYQGLCDRAQTLMAKAAAAGSFFTPEVLEIPREKLLGFLSESEELKVYEHVLLEMLREKEHILSKPEENILAQMSEVTSATNDIFTMLNNADIKFGTILDEKGEEKEVTHGRYIGFLESQDRRVRKDAFERMYTAYENQINTIATTYSYNTKVDVVSARIRKYPSALEAALSGDNIPVSVYDNLIAVVNEHLPAVHRYMEIRRKALNLDQVHMYDVYAPLIQIPEEEVTYEAALEQVREGLAPLGEQYLKDMEAGLQARWIDVYENEGKTSGAYSFGSYDSFPYILLNFNSKLKDVFTIAHEMGHSMHSFYTRQAQPFVYGSHSIFTAEVASTVNENLLMKHMIETETDPEKKKYLLALHIEEFRTTVFRQTMFAEFEKLTHEAAESGEVLTAEWLSAKYAELNAKYFGPDVFQDPLIALEWARIPHFYRAFYVYKYATGYSAAAAISDKILSEGKPAQEAYLNFLKTGESDYPIELLKIAGVDMSKPEPIEAAMKTFEALITELEGCM
ncbi:MAG: oligoendopeptidase F, partial [Firmicutes bacterium]|nr:oligoendopeptidase F [Bacillota bacterium]